MKGSSYALITPARNEEIYIRRTIQCVRSQTILPIKWVIVDDGSNDRTSEIALSYALRDKWITVVRREAVSSRNFRSKVEAFEVGSEKLVKEDYEFLGNLDADVEFAPEYYERLIEFFNKEPKLGIAGGSFSEIGKDGKCRPVVNSIDSVRGAVQLFRRKCYEDVGGYLLLPMGGEDSAAQIMARMKGWMVRTFPDLTVLHLRPTGGDKSLLSALVRRGSVDRSLGYSGSFETVRCFAHMNLRPYIIGGLSVLFGYCWSWLRGTASVLPAGTVSFLRGEQRAKLVRNIRRIISSKD